MLLPFYLFTYIILPNFFNLNYLTCFVYFEAIFVPIDVLNDLDVNESINMMAQVMQLGVGLHKADSIVGCRIVYVIFPIS